MAAAARLLLALAATACAGAARDCLELTIARDAILNDTLNDTLFNATFRPPGTDRGDGARVTELWDSFPKILVPSNGTTERCRRDSRRFLDGLDRLELWALKMYDATAKLPSGLLNGNVNQYGDFDQCLSIDGAVRGKYCLASLEVTLAGDSNMVQLDNMIHSMHYLRSNVTDMGHRVPRYSSMLWGVCLPSSCSSHDLEDELAQRLAGLSITAKVHSTMCSVQGNVTPYSFGKALSIAFFLAILLLLSLGTMLDDGGEPVTNFDRLLNAFSLRRNVRKLLDLNDSQSHIKGLDAFRGINAIALIFAHKSMAVSHNAYSNKRRLAEVFGMHWAVLGRSAILYTDSFLYLSGFLNAHNLMQELQKTGTIDIKNKLVSRWFRLFPLFLSVMLFSTYVLPDLNSGPQWNLVVQEHGRVCRRTMWRSFLFIHNYFGFEDMCLTHTHQIGMDMQLYVATLPLMLLLWRRRNLGWTLVAAVAVASTLLRYLSVVAHEISMVVYYGISVQKLLDAARFCYILPTHRATIYLIGVFMAYMLRTKKISVKLSSNQVRALWAAAFSIALYTLLAPYKMGLPDYEFEARPAAVFAALSPVAWGLFMCLAHWAICNDYAGVGSIFVESRFFKLFNKIAYGVYLTQFPIFFYNVGVQRAPGFYTPFNLIDIPEMLVIFTMSILTTVAIEMPFNEVYRIYFGKSKTKLKDK